MTGRKLAGLRGGEGSERRGRILARRGEQRSRSRREEREETERKEGRGISARGAEWSRMCRDTL